MRTGIKITLILPFLSKLKNVAAESWIKVIEDYPLEANILAAFAIMSLIVLAYRGLKEI